MNVDDECIIQTKWFLGIYLVWGQVLKLNMCKPEDTNLLKKQKHLPPKVSSYFKTGPKDVDLLYAGQMVWLPTILWSMTFYLD